MRAGALKHNIILVDFLSSRNDFGEVIEEYYEVLHTRADIKPALGAKEKYTGVIVLEIVPVDIFLRVPFIEIKGSMHLIYKNRVYEIDGVVNNNEHNVLMTLRCLENKNPSADKLNYKTPPGVNLKIGAVYNESTSTWEQATKQF